MFQLEDQAYYLRRYDDEMRRGNQCFDRTVAAIHFELAHRYALRAARIGLVRPELALVDGGHKTPPPHAYGSKSESRALHLQSA